MEAYKEKKPYYITTAIAYASAKPHIGNTYEIVLADAIARFRREQGYDVRFMTGTDEHGQKIENKAADAGLEPQAYVDKTAAEIKRIWDLMNTSYDKFIRTTDEYHVKQIQKCFKKMYAKGDIYKGSYEGWYCVPDEAFWTESQIVDGCCPECGRPVVKASEEAYFFKMSKYADRLIEHINTHPEFIQPVSRKNEMMNNFLLPGLQDLCVSRTSFKWGIPVDFDSKHVVYVWLDALTNYITGLGFNCDGDPDEESGKYADSSWTPNGPIPVTDDAPGKEIYAKYWPCDLHLIGKDIIRFHTIYWPIFLMSLDQPLPKQVFGHPWLMMSDGKMSKSRGNVLYADDLVDIFGVDAVRYFVLHEMPFENDGIISWDLMIERYNGDLANILGNLVQRTISMTSKYFGGIVETNDCEDEEGIDDDLIQTILACCEKAEKKMDELRVADAITENFNIFRRLNKYIDETMPWALAKDPEKQERLKTVLYNLTEGITIGASLLQSFMPETAEKILAELKTEKRELQDMDTFGMYPNGQKIVEKPEMLFARLDPAEVMTRVEAIQAAQRAAAGVQEPAPEEACANATKEETPAEEEPAPLEHKPEITFDDFAKIELRVGEVIACEEVPKSKKLLKETISFGSETRTILSGIKNWYKPEDMVGKKVVVVMNLAPRKIAGFESQGMIVAAESADGEMVSLLSPENKDIPAGSIIG